MRRKYQLRGLGIGVILGVLLMGVFAGAKEETLTDSQIRERAKALGMEETMIGSDLSDKQTQEVLTSEEPTSEVTTGTEEMSTMTEVNTTKEAESAEEVPSEVIATSEAISNNRANATSEEAEEPTSAVGKAVVITILGGDGSGVVSRKLAEAGLISNAAEYDKYLCSNGYDKRLKAGKHEIRYGATKEEIAKSISSK